VTPHWLDVVRDGGRVALATPLHMLADGVRGLVGAHGGAVLGGGADATGGEGETRRNDYCYLTRFHFVP
jgi:hypothetical protein